MHLSLLSFGHRRCHYFLLVCAETGEARGESEPPHPSRYWVAKSTNQPLYRPASHWGPIDSSHGDGRDKFLLGFSYVERWVSCDSDTDAIAREGRL